MGRTIMAAITANFYKFAKRPAVVLGSGFQICSRLGSFFRFFRRYCIMRSPFDTIESEDVEYISSKFQKTISKKSQIPNKENFKLKRTFYWLFCFFILPFCNLEFFGNCFLELGAFMYYIIGSGNPGTEYDMTRHNTGRIILSAFLKKYDFPAAEFDKKLNTLVSTGNLQLTTYNLSCPETFMNKSGDTSES